MLDNVLKNLSDEGPVRRLAGNRIVGNVPRTGDLKRLAGGGCVSAFGFHGLDCGTIDGIYVSAIMEGGDILEPLRDRIVGRVSQEELYDPMTGELLLGIGEEFTVKLAAKIQSAGIERVKIRSVLTCESRRGVCIQCYGRNLATGKTVDIGEAVGVLDDLAVPLTMESNMNC